MFLREAVLDSAARAPVFAGVSVYVWRQANPHTRTHTHSLLHACVVCLHVLVVYLCIHICVFSSCHSSDGSVKYTDVSHRLQLHYQNEI